MLTLSIRRIITDALSVATDKWVELGIAREVWVTSNSGVSEKRETWVDSDVRLAERFAVLYLIEAMNEWSKNMPVAFRSSEIATDSDRLLYVKTTSGGIKKNWYRGITLRTLKVLEATYPDRVISIPDDITEDSDIHKFIEFRNMQFIPTSYKKLDAYCKRRGITKQIGR